MSKFDKIFEARQDVVPETPQKVATPKKSVGKKSKPSLVTPLPSPPTPSPVAVKRRGRPRAKRSDPDYVGFTTYIHRDTHHKVKLRLLANKQGQELSELVEALLRQWLAGK